jgi:hypothetical protein
MRVPGRTEPLRASAEIDLTAGETRTLRLNAAPGPDGWLRLRLE